MFRHLVPFAVVGLASCGAARMGPLDLPAAPAPSWPAPCRAATWDEAACLGTPTDQVAWVAQAGAPATDRVRVLLIGDAGYRDGDVVGPSTMAVATAAREACRPGCDAGVLLGDNVYPSGITTDADADFFATLVAAFAFVDDLHLILGNHDWGPGAALRQGYHAPSRTRALAAYREAERHGLGGLGHFWATDLGPLHLVGLDTNFVVRRCDLRGDDIDCAGAGDLNALTTALHATDAPWTLTVGHHAWRSNGGHGGAGHLRDMGLRLWPGRALEALLADVDTDLYAAGHDHDTQLFLADPAEPGPEASAVVGASGKIHARGRVEAEAAFESYCTLGFSIVEAEADRLTLELHTLPHPDPERTAECARGLDPGLDPVGCVAFSRTATTPWAPAECGG